MNDCMGTDALASIAAALEWKLDAGLEHLRTCAECRTRLAVMVSIHQAVALEIDVPEKTLTSIGQAIKRESDLERGRSRNIEVFVKGAEALLAGVTAVVAVISARVDLGGSVLPLAVAFAIGSSATLLWGPGNSDALAH